MTWNTRGSFSRRGSIRRGSLRRATIAWGTEQPQPYTPDKSDQVRSGTAVWHDVQQSQVQQQHATQQSGLTGQ
jgi:hypothetical protein